MMLVLSVNLKAASVFQIQRGKYHGLIDTGLAVITFKPGGYRMDIDAEEQIYHIKVSSVGNCPMLYTPYATKCLDGLHKLHTNFFKNNAFF